MTRVGSQRYRKKNIYILKYFFFGGFLFGSRYYLLTSHVYVYFADILAPCDVNSWRFRREGTREYTVLAMSL